MNMKNMRKGALSGYNYVVLTIVFMIFFSTGLAIASESIEGISEVVGITPPSEIKACETVQTELYENNTIFKIGEGYPFENEEDFTVQRNGLNTTENNIKLDDGDTGGNIVITKNFENVHTLESINLATSNFAPDGYPDGSQVIVRISEYDFDYLNSELIKEIRYNTSYSNIQEETISFDNQTIGKLRVGVWLSRDNTSYQPILYHLALNGQELDEKVEYVFYKDIVSELSDLYGRAKQITVCGIMQLSNLFKAVTFSTGEWWLDMVLIPFQIVLVIIIVRITAEIVSSFPFT